MIRIMISFNSTCILNLEDDQHLSILLFILFEFMYTGFNHEINSKNSSNKSNILKTKRTLKIMRPYCQQWCYAYHDH